MTYPGIAKVTGILQSLIPGLLGCHHWNMVSGLVSASQGHCISAEEEEEEHDHKLWPDNKTVMHLQVLDNGSTCREVLTWLSTWEAQDAISANTQPSSCYHREESHERDQDQDWVQNVRICWHVQFVL